MPALSKKDKLRLLTTILESRHADLREQNLNRQGKGHFHVSGMGHEALAAVSFLMEPEDIRGNVRSLPCPPSTLRLSRASTFFYSKQIRTIVDLQVQL